LRTRRANSKRERLADGNPTACLCATTAGLPHVEDQSRTITGKLGFATHICVIAASAAVTSTNLNALWSPSALKICAKESGQITTFCKFAEGF
jgi:hypothetical protein